MTQLTKRVEKLEALNGVPSDAVGTIIRVIVDPSSEGPCYEGRFHVRSIKPRRAIMVDRADMAGVLKSALPDDQRQQLQAEVLEEAQLRWAAAA